jgi:hypothetical protein
MSAVPDAAKLSRRGLLRSVAGGAAVAALAGPADAQAAARQYPRVRIRALSRLTVNRPVSFAYPLEEQPNVLLDQQMRSPAASSRPLALPRHHLGTRRRRGAALALPLATPTFRNGVRRRRWWCAETVKARH